MQHMVTLVQKVTRKDPASGREISRLMTCHIPSPSAKAAEQLASTLRAGKFTADHTVRLMIPTGSAVISVDSLMSAYEALTETED